MGGIDAGTVKCMYVLKLKVYVYIKFWPWEVLGATVLKLREKTECVKYGPHM